MEKVYMVFENESPASLVAFRTYNDAMSAIAITWSNSRKPENIRVIEVPVMPFADHL